MESFWECLKRFVLDYEKKIDELQRNMKV